MIIYLMNSFYHRDPSILGNLLLVFSREFVQMEEQCFLNVCVHVCVCVCVCVCV